jgi:hypothetical protein
MVMANMAVLYRAARAMRRFPGQHDQSYWQLMADGQMDVCGQLATAVLADNSQAPSCGTKLCGGGWIAFQNAPAGSVLKGRLVVLPDGSEREIEGFATEAAELTEDQAYSLFFRAADMDEFDAMLDELEANPAADLSDLREARDRLRQVGAGRRRAGRAVWQRRAARCRVPLNPALVRSRGNWRHGT